VSPTQMFCKKCKTKKKMKKWTEADRRKNFESAKYNFQNNLDKFFKDVYDSI